LLKNYFAQKNVTLRFSKGDKPSNLGYMLLQVPVPGMKANDGDITSLSMTSRKNLIKESFSTPYWRLSFWFDELYGFSSTGTRGE
jgi:hypothetical protein